MRSNGDATRAAPSAHCACTLCMCTEHVHCVHVHRVRVHCVRVHCARVHCAHVHCACADAALCIHIRGWQGGGSFEAWAVRELFVSMCVCMCTRVHVHPCACAPVCMCTRVHVHAYACACVCFCREGAWGVGQRGSKKYNGGRVIVKGSYREGRTARGLTWLRHVYACIHARARITHAHACGCACVSVCMHGRNREACVCMYACMHACGTARAR